MKIPMENQKAETRANIKLLNRRRDRIICKRDIKDTFKYVNKKIDDDSLEWIDSISYLYSTLKDLEKRGCNVKRYMKKFKKETKKILK